MRLPRNFFARCSLDPEATPGPSVLTAFHFGKQHLDFLPSPFTHSTCKSLALSKLFSYYISPDNICHKFVVSRLIRSVLSQSISREFLIKYMINFAVKHESRCVPRSYGLGGFKFRTLSQEPEEFSRILWEKAFIMFKGPLRSLKKNHWEPSNLGPRARRHDHRY